MVPWTDKIGLSLKRRDCCLLSLLAHSASYSHTSESSSQSAMPPHCHGSLETSALAHTIYELLCASLSWFLGQTRSVLVSFAEIFACFLSSPTQQATVTPPNLAPSLSWFLGQTRSVLVSFAHIFACFLSSPTQQATVTPPNLAPSQPCRLIAMVPWRLLHSHTLFTNSSAPPCHGSLDRQDRY